MNRRGMFRKLLALAGCAAAGVLCSGKRAEGANYGFRSGHRCPACGATVVVVASWRRDGRHWHRHGDNWWWH